MAKVIGPLLSIGAGGQIGKSQIYAKWRGVPYARRYAVPSNPNTLAQQSTRNTFRTLSQMWGRVGGPVLDAYSTAIIGKPMTPTNKFIQTNLPSLRGEANMNLWLASPGARSGPAPASFSAVQSGANITGTLVEGVLPTGWTITQGVMVMFTDQDPEAGEFVTAITDDTVSATPFNFSLAHAGYGPTVCLSAFLEYLTPAGLAAFSIALNDQVTIV